MIKRVTLVRRADHLGPTEFATYWVETHAQLARRLDGLRGYRVNLINHKPNTLPWDGFGEAWFDSIGAAEAAFSVEPLRSELQEDVARFASETMTFFVSETVIVPLTERKTPRGPALADGPPLDLEQRTAQGTDGGSD